MRRGTAPEQGDEIDSKYRLGPCLTAGDRYQVYETTYRGTPAAMRVFVCESSGGASDLADGFEHGCRFRHPNLLDVYDFGYSRTRAWVVTERWDECLADVLRDRPLTEAELRQLLEGVVPALECLQESELSPGRLTPDMIYAAGDTIKLGPGRFVACASAPCNGELAELILETLTGTPDRAGIDKLNSPFREMVRDEWDLRRISEALSPEAAASAQAVSQVPICQVEIFPRPKYRKFAALAIGGAFAAAALCALLVRGAHHASDPQDPPSQSFEQKTNLTASQTQSAAPALSDATAKVARAQASYPIVKAGWAVVGASFQNEGVSADNSKVTSAEASAKRFAAAGKRHSGIVPQVYSSNHGLVVLFASGLTETEAKRQLARVKRAGAPRGTYITRFE